MAAEDENLPASPVPELKVVNLEEEKAKKRQRGRDRLLKNMLANPYDKLYTRVAAVLNKHIEARNSDQELQFRYWEAYEGYKYGNHITPEELKKYTKLTSLTRARSKIQNEYGLFRANPVVEEFRGKLAGKHKEKAVAVKPQKDPFIFVYADESGKTGKEAYLIIGSVWFIDLQRHQEVQANIRKWLAENREKAKENKTHFPKEFHFTEMKKNHLDIYKSFFDKVMEYSDMVSFKAVAVKKSQIEYKSLEESIYSLYYQLAHLGIEHEVKSSRLSLPRGICYYKDRDDGSDKLHLAETRQLLEERFKINYEDNLRLESMDGLPSQTYVTIQIADLITAAVSRKLNAENVGNHKDKFAEYVLEKLNVDYIKHEVSTIDNGKTQANIEFKEEQDMFYVHIFE